MNINTIVTCNDASSKYDFKSSSIFRELPNITLLTKLPKFQPKQFGMSISVGLTERAQGEIPET
jgi:hypothetical protein